MIRTRLLVALSLTLALAVGGAPASYAQSRSVGDRAGDTRPEVVPEADARRASVDYSRGRLRVVVKVPRLAHKNAFVDAYLDKAGGSTWPDVQYLRIKKSATGTRVGYYEYSDYIGDVHRRPCRIRGSWSVRTGTVTLTAPKRCIPWRKVKVNVVTYAATSTASGSDRLRRMVVRYN